MDKDKNILLENEWRLVRKDEETGFMFSINYMDIREDNYTDYDKETHIWLSHDDGKEPVAILIIVGDLRKEFRECTTIKQCIDMFYKHRSDVWIDYN